MLESIADLELPAHIVGILERVTAEFAEDPITEGVLFHGSFVKGRQHADSDLDLLRATRGDWMKMEIREVGGRHVEIRHSPLSQLRRELHRKEFVNNNFMLSTLREGRVLFDRQEALTALVAEAEERHSQTPPASTEFERYKSRNFLRNRRGEIRRLVAAGKLGEARMLADMVMHRCLFVYCKHHQRWALKPLEMVAQLSAENDELAEIFEQFFAAPTAREMLPPLERFLDQVVAPIGWGGELRTFGPVPVDELD